MSDHGVARDQLRAIVERVERLHEERKAIADDIREIYAEAKGGGFDVPTIKEVVKIRSKDQNAWAEKTAMLDLYLHALGMAPDPDASRVHVHEDADHNPITGEFTDEPADPESQTIESVNAPIETVATDGNTGGEHEVAQALHGHIDETGNEGPAPLTAGGVSDARAFGSAVEVGARDSNSHAADKTGGEKSPSAPASFADRIKQLRPHCQRPGACRSSGGKEHCFTCRTAMAEREGVTA